MSGGIKGVPGAGYGTFETGKASRKSEGGSEVQGTGSGQSRVDGASKGNPAADRVVLSDTSAIIKALEEEMLRVPAVDLQRIESIRKALDEGTYEIDDRRVADKLVQLERLLHAGEK